jgi:choline dehydrogenase-like flavoprotein
VSYKRHRIPPQTIAHAVSLFEERGSKFDIRRTPQARLSKGTSSRPSCHGSASWIPVCLLQAKYDATVHIARAETLGVRLLTETYAKFVDCPEDGRVTAVRFRHLDGSEGRVQPRVLVAAANAMEMPRLLLASRSSLSPAGVANRSGLVGRHLMDHPIQLSWALARGEGC